MYWMNKQNSYRTQNVDALLEVVDRAIKMLPNNLDERMFEIWFNYSKEILGLIVKGGNPTILIDYLELSVDLLRKDLPPHYKLKSCIDFLLEVVKKI